MALNARTAPSGGGRKSPPMEPATYPARLVQVIDMGLQPQEYQGETKAPMNEVSITWEFVDEFLVDENNEPVKDKPRWVSETFPLYNLKADKAKSTLRYKALDPKGEKDGDWVALLGSPASVTVVVNERKTGIYNNVAAAQPMRDKDAKTCPPLINVPKCFDLSSPDLEVFLSLPQWLKDRIKSNLEYEGSKLQKLLNDMGTGQPPASAKTETKPVQKKPVSDEESKPW